MAQCAMSNALITATQATVIPPARCELPEIRPGVQLPVVYNPSSSLIQHSGGSGTLPVTSMSKIKF